MRSALVALKWARRKTENRDPELLRILENASGQCQTLGGSLSAAGIFLAPGRCWLKTSPRPHAPQAPGSPRPAGALSQVLWGLPPHLALPTQLPGHSHQPEQCPARSLAPSPAPCRRLVKPRSLAWHSRPLISARVHPSLSRLHALSAGCHCRCATLPRHQHAVLDCPLALELALEPSSSSVCTYLSGVVQAERGGAVGGMWELSVVPAQSCWEPKKVLRNDVS